MRTVFLLPYAGGSSLLYRDWEVAETRLVALDYPGHSMDEMLGGVQPLSSFDALLSHMTEVMISRLDGLAWENYGIFGHSMGGLLAYHIAVELRRKKAPIPMNLYLSAVTPPDALDTERIGRYATDEGFTDYLSLYGRLDEKRLNSRIFKQYFQPVIQEDFRLISRYHESEAYRQLSSNQADPIPVSVDVIYSPEDTIMRPKDMSGWSAYTSLPVTMHILKGDHFYIEEKEQKKEIITWLNSCMSMTK